jgi:hypothetical protein
LTRRDWQDGYFRAPAQPGDPIPDERRRPLLNQPGPGIVTGFGVRTEHAADGEFAFVGAVVARNFFLPRLEGGAESLLEVAVDAKVVADPRPNRITAA